MRRPAGALHVALAPGGPAGHPAVADSGTEREDAR